MTAETAAVNDRRNTAPEFPIYKCPPMGDGGTTFVSTLQASRPGRAASPPAMPKVLSRPVNLRCCLPPAPTVSTQVRFSRHYPGYVRNILRLQCDHPLGTISKRFEHCQSMMKPWGDMTITCFAELNIVQTIFAQPILGQQCIATSWAPLHKARCYHQPNLVR